MPAALKAITEGLTRLLVPGASVGARAPATYPVFFNQAARLNRDVSVAIAASTGPRTYLDALAGTGARGIRISNEAAPGAQVTLVDFNEKSLSIAKRSIRKNELEARCSTVHSEANRYLYSRFERAEKFDAVDLDPFGTPAPYILGALVASADDALLSFTATDAAVLCGVYPAVSLRRYGAAAPRSEFVHETAVRILAGFAARMGGVNDIGVEPLAAHSTLHYLRVYVRVRRGATAADQAQKGIGYTVQCNSCHSRFSEPTPPPRCPTCGSRVKPAGPLWTGKLCDDRLVRSAADFCRERGWDDSAATLSSLVGLDRFPPYSYSLERAASRVGSSSVPLEVVAGRLESAGFRCMRQPFEEISIKTDATAEDLQRVVKGASVPLA